MIHRIKWQASFYKDDKIVLDYTDIRVGDRPPMDPCMYKLQGASPGELCITVFFTDSAPRDSLYQTIKDGRVDTVKVRTTLQDTVLEEWDILNPKIKVWGAYRDELRRHDQHCIDIAMQYYECDWTNHEAPCLE